MACALRSQLSKEKLHAIQGVARGCKPAKGHQLQSACRELQGIVSWSRMQLKLHAEGACSSFWPRGWCSALVITQERHTIHL
eukprot:scaffold163216_cov19-Tisochrysis_lutea.AAC.1